MKGYVVYKGRRYRIVNPSKPNEQEEFDRLLRLRPFKGADVQVRASDVSPWHRGGLRRFRGTLPHRGGRPVFITISTSTETITARLKGKRKGFTCTFDGLYDVLARQEAMNAKRDRAFAKRTGRRK